MRDWVLKNKFAGTDLCKVSLFLLMASKTGVRPSPEQQQKAVGAYQTVERNDGRSLAMLCPKTSKPELVSPGLVPDSKQITAKQVIVESSDSKKSPNYDQRGSSDSSTNKSDSNNISSPNVEQVSAIVGSKVPVTSSSLEVFVDQEKKISEHGSVKTSSVSTKVSDGTSSLGKTSGSAKISDRADFVESGKSSMCRGSTSSDVSDESTCSSFSSRISKPHKANDLRWEAIQAVRARDGVLGLSHFRLLKRLGCGDIGSVYLAELSGTKSYFAMKVMDKASLASRKKLLRAQTEREILQTLDHPFLPSLYTHFETDKFSCLVMEFCPGGDLHTLRQRQPGKHFSEQAVKYDVLSSTPIIIRLKSETESGYLH
ncbi:unnamed protein product [Ilex paraguariensis]|uniref:non-specific serine/threonine protein kinase n=1 Tax=Ilex paraguariensis TaxID=185542 RepID=A0ABC8SL76_9AQUA